MMQIQVIVINFRLKIITIATTVLFNVSSLKWNHNNIRCNDKKRYRSEKRRRLEKEHVVIFKDLIKMRIINPLCLQNILTRHKIVCLFSLDLTNITSSWYPYENYDELGSFSRFFANINISWNSLCSDGRYSVNVRFLKVGLQGC